MKWNSFLILVNCARPLGLAFFWRLIMDFTIYLIGLFIGIPCLVFAGILVFLAWDWDRDSMRSWWR